MHQLSHLPVSREAGSLAGSDASLEALDALHDEVMEHLGGCVLVAEFVPEQRYPVWQAPLHPLHDALTRGLPKHGHQHGRLQVHLHAKCTSDTRAFWACC